MTPRPLHPSQQQRPDRTSQREPARVHRSDGPKPRVCTLAYLARPHGSQVRIAILTRTGDRPVLSVGVFGADGVRLRSIDIIETDIDELEKAILAYRNTARTTT